MSPSSHPGKVSAEAKYFAVANSSAKTLAASTEKSAAKQTTKLCPPQFTQSSLSTLAHGCFHNVAAIILEKLRLSRSSAQPPETAAEGSIESLALIAIFLRESVDIVEKIFAKNLIYLRQLDSRSDKRVARKRIAKYCKDFTIEQRQDYQNLLREDKRSRILASYHFGDYVYGMNSLTCLDYPQRKRYVLSQSMANTSYYENLKNGLGARAIDRSAELICSQTKISELSLLLRNGNSTLVMFCDLPVGFGGRVEVKFLNRIASFPKGPALLAISNRAPLLPVINYRDDSGNRTALGTQIEPFLNCDESLQAGVSRITQELVCFFEHFFKKYPEQWRYLQALPSYYLRQ